MLSSLLGDPLLMGEHCDPRESRDLGLGAVVQGS